MIDYNDVKKVRPLCKFLLQMSAYRVHIFFSKMSAFENDELLEKYYKI